MVEFCEGGGLESRWKSGVGGRSVCLSVYLQQSGRGAGGVPEVTYVSLCWKNLVRGERLGRFGISWW